MIFVPACATWGQGISSWLFQIVEKVCCYREKYFVTKKSILLQREVFCYREEFFATEKKVCYSTKLDSAGSNTPVVCSELIQKQQHTAAQNHSKAAIFFVYERKGYGCHWSRNNWSEAAPHFPASHSFKLIGRQRTVNQATHWQRQGSESSQGSELIKSTN